MNTCPNCGDPCEDYTCPECWEPYLAYVTESAANMTALPTPEVPR